MNETLIHQTIWNALSRAAEQDKVFHAYLFEGSAGIGKKTLANRFAMALHCEGENKPCMTCPSCLKHRAQSHPDYEVCAAEAGRQSLSVKAVRSACEHLFIRPLVSKRKILFIPQAERCEAGAQNALLKCLEEPPPYAVILLSTTHLSALLPTIRSRTAIYSLSPCAHDTLCRLIETTYALDADERLLIASLSSGLIGRAVRLCEDEGLREALNRLFMLLCHMHESRYKALEVADFLSGQSDEDGFLFECCLLYLRDVTLYALSGKKPLLSRYSALIEQAAKAKSAKAWTRALYCLSSAKADKASYVNESLWITKQMITLWEVLND